MTSCPDCTKALAERWHGGYRMGCAGCAARAVARSLATFEAATQRTDAAIERLRDTITRAIPGLPYEQAHALVTQWWRRDHSERTA